LPHCFPIISISFPDAFPIISILCHYVTMSFFPRNIPWNPQNILTPLDRCQVALVGVSRSNQVFVISINSNLGPWPNGCAPIHKT
jgi:hypothetical protein